MKDGYKGGDGYQKNDESGWYDDQDYDDDSEDDSEDSLESSRFPDEFSSQFEIKYGDNNEVIGEIASGITGDVLRLKYIGDDEKIKSLSDEDGYVIVKTLKTSEDNRAFNKHAKITFNNEIQNIQSLSQHNDDKSLRRPKTTLFECSDGTTFIINECIYSNKEDKTSQTMAKHVANLSKNPYYSENAHVLAATLAEIELGKILAVQELHEHGLGHFDLGNRNVLRSDNVMPTMLCDFGMSLKIKDKMTGLAETDPGFLLTPTYLYDKAALPKENRVFSTYTDLFGLKVSAMETTAAFMGLADSQSEMEKQIHYKHLDARSLENAVAITVDKNKDIDLNQLKNIQAQPQNKNKSILIKHGDDIKIYGNAESHYNNPEDWKVTKLCTRGDMNYKNMNKAFDSRKVSVKMVEAKPSIEEIEKSLGKDKHPILFVNPEFNAGWMYRYSNKKNKWTVTQLDEDKIKKSNFFSQLNVNMNDEIKIKDSHALDELVFFMNKRNLFPPEATKQSDNLLEVELTLDQEKFIESRKGHAKQSYLSAMMEEGNEDRLKRTYDNVVSYTESKVNNDAEIMRKDAGLIFLETYQSYLTSFTVNPEVNAYDAEKAIITDYCQCTSQLMVDGIKSVDVEHVDAADSLKMKEITERVAVELKHQGLENEALQITQCISDHFVSGYRVVLQDHRVMVAAKVYLTKANEIKKTNGGKVGEVDLDKCIDQLNTIIKDIEKRGAQSTNVVITKTAFDAVNHSFKQVQVSVDQAKKDSLKNKNENKSVKNKM